MALAARTVIRTAMAAQRAARTATVVRPADRRGPAELRMAATATLATTTATLRDRKSLNYSPAMIPPCGRSPDRSLTVLIRPEPRRPSVLWSRVQPQSVHPKD